MAIVNITIDTDRLGDTPKVQLDGHDIKELYDIYFIWSSPRGPLLPSTSNLIIKRWSDHMYGHHTLDYLNDHVMQKLTWETTSKMKPLNLNNKDGD